MSEYRHPFIDNHRKMKLAGVIIALTLAILIPLLVTSIYHYNLTHAGLDFRADGGISSSTPIETISFSSGTFDSRWTYLDSGGEPPTIVTRSDPKDSFLSLSSVNQGIMTPKNVDYLPETLRVKILVAIEGKEMSQVDFTDVFHIEGLGEDEKVKCNIYSYYLDKNGYLTYTLTDTKIEYTRITINKMVDIETSASDPHFGIKEVKYVLVNS